eukprot:TRINITY_DN8050_c0_g1_i1.p1 TRINITY_DN8050_c0_g1~~TRINITY_DN8050_c0_g1_i1.p1  ORF type:complete len:126 (+),score=29.84 TRINITY_DN8050_c0_g1_i1:160-537(+)
MMLSCRAPNELAKLKPQQQNEGEFNRRLNGGQRQLFRTGLPLLPFALARIPPSLSCRTSHRSASTLALQELIDRAQLARELHRKFTNYVDLLNTFNRVMLRKDLVGYNWKVKTIEEMKLDARTLR